MTFIMDARLTIEIHDLIKSRGGKLTVFKQLQLWEKRKPVMRLPKMFRKDEEISKPETEIVQGLRSLYMSEYSWEAGWNHAECADKDNPIPVIANHGIEISRGLIHCWLKERDFNQSIPFELRLEDFEFAGRPSTGHTNPLHIGSLSSIQMNFPTNQVVRTGAADASDIHLGVKKLYLYQADFEMGVKMYLENRKKASVEHMTAAEIRAIQEVQLQQAALLSQQIAHTQRAPFSPSSLGNTLFGGIL